MLPSTTPPLSAPFTSLRWSSKSTVSVHKSLRSLVAGVQNHNLDQITTGRLLAYSLAAAVA